MSFVPRPLAGSYLDELLPILRKFEAFFSVVYDDKAAPGENSMASPGHYPTIGDGILLWPTNNAGSNLALVLNKLGVFAASDTQEALLRQLGELPPENEAQRNARYDQILAGFNQLFDEYRLSRSNQREGQSPSEVALQGALEARLASYGVTRSFELEDLESIDVKRQIIEGAKIGLDLDGDGKWWVEEKGKEYRLDKLLNDNGIQIAHETHEYVALMSLFYNGEALVGPKLRKALGANRAAPNRAEAWFEIRYNSNSKDEGIQAGIAKRRYYESEIFGLYDDSDVDLNEAKQVYRMFTEHRQEIGLYEQRFGIAFDGSPGTRLISRPPDESERGQAWHIA